MIRVQYSILKVKDLNDHGFKTQSRNNVMV